MSTFTADHNGFFLGGERFYPKVQDKAAPLESWSNAAVVHLPAHLSDDLDWSKEKALADEIVASGKSIVWEMDLGLEKMPFLPEDSATFYALSLAIEEFSKSLWPGFEAQTLGVILYRGQFNPHLSFPLSHWEPLALEWLAELGIEHLSDYSLYCAQALSEYLHRLVSFLPDAVLPFALIDVTEISSPARIAQLFSKERFEHLNLAFKGSPCPFSGICWEEGRAELGWIGNDERKDVKIPAPTIGIYLPKDNDLSESLKEKLDKLLARLNEKGTLYRIVPEEKLTEQWDGLDDLIVSSCSLSTQGKRKLQGFAAAGGTILPYEDT